MLEELRKLNILDKHLLLPGPETLKDSTPPDSGYAFYVCVCGCVYISTSLCSLYATPWLSIDTIARSWTISPAPKMLETCPNASGISVLLLGSNYSRVEAMRCRRIGTSRSGCGISVVSPARLVGSFYVCSIDETRLEAVQKYEPTYDLHATCAAYRRIHRISYYHSVHLDPKADKKGGLTLRWKRDNLENLQKTCLDPTPAESPKHCTYKPAPC